MIRQLRLTLNKATISGFNFSGALRQYGHCSSNTTSLSLPGTAAVAQRNDSNPWSLMQTRSHWRIVRSQRAPPTKPLNFDYSGDMDQSVGTIDPKAPRVEYENVPELQNASETVKKLFSLEFGTHMDLTNKLINDIVKKVQDHPQDVKSLEVKIAKCTINIRLAIQHCLRFRNDKVSKANLIELIHKRRGHLKFLMLQDTEKFKWLQSELRLRYIDDAEFFRKKLSKRARREKTACDAANEQINNKINQLRATLEAERVKFEEFKEAELEDIERELQQLGIPVEVMSSLESTFEALGVTDILPKPVPRIGRSRFILEKQIALYGARKKIQDAEILHNHGFLTPEEFSHHTDQQ